MTPDKPTLRNLHWTDPGRKTTNPDGTVTVEPTFPTPVTDPQETAGWMDRESKAYEQGRTDAIEEARNALLRYQQMLFAGTVDRMVITRCIRIIEGELSDDELQDLLVLEDEPAQ